MAASLSGAETAASPVVHIQHFTDPLSAWCWAVEPVLLHLSELLGGFVSLEHRMSGLLEVVEPEEDTAEQPLNRPTQLSMLWEEVAHLSGMPLDGDVWLERPVPSSWPACAAVKAAQAQDPGKAARYLRRLREAALCGRENVFDAAVLVEHAAAVGLNGQRLDWDLESGAAGTAFEEDMREASEMGAISPPSFFFFGPAGLAEIRGARSFDDMASAIEQVAGEPLPLCAAPEAFENRQGYLKALVLERGSLTAAEVVELLDLDRSVATDLLDRMAAGGSLRRRPVGTSALYLPV